MQIKKYSFEISPNDNEIVFYGRIIDNIAVIFDDIAEVRYVIIPEWSTRMAIGYTDYEAVKKAYNLKD